MKTRIEINPAFAPAVTTDAVMRVVSDFDNCGELVFDGRNKLRRVNICGADVVVKRFKPFNAIRRISRRFRRSKAIRAYYNGLKLMELGIMTPEPLAYIEVRNWWGALVDSYYICRYQSLQALETVFDDDDALNCFATFAVELHTAGVLHHDLNRTNVCFDPANPARFWLIDINRMTFCKPTIRDRRDNLQRFCSSGPMFEKFTAKYLSEAGLDAELLPSWIAAKANWDNRRAQKKKFKKVLKKVLHPGR